MNKKTIVITGANSYLGQTVLTHLLETTDWKIYAIISPRGSNELAKKYPRRIKYFQADLTAALTSSLQSILKDADSVFHFAWIRAKKLEESRYLNEQMIDYLMGAMNEPSKFYFISSVAASSKAISVYGRSKYYAMKRVKQKGGISLVCGLVVDKPARGPFKMLTTCVKSLPFSFRFEESTAPIYAISVDEVSLAVQKICEMQLNSGCYQLFKNGENLNHFLMDLETHYPRTRLPLKLSAAFLLKTALVLKRFHLAPSGLCEKLLTFFYKDVEALMSCNKIPNLIL